MMSNILSRIEALPAEKQAYLIRQLRRQQGTVEPTPGYYDVAILGGGVAGLTLALQLKKTRPDIRVLVVERQKHPAPEAAHKVGESTVEIAAHYLRDISGLEEHLQTQQLRKFGLRMFFSDQDNQDIARRVQIGSTVFPPLCTYQLDRGRLENALSEKIIQEGIDFLDASKVTAVTLQPEAAHHRVQILTTGDEREILAGWLLDASGRSQLLQRQMDLSKKVGHAANAVWFRTPFWPVP